jgi:hypothetical protein
VGERTAYVSHFRQTFLKPAIDPSPSEPCLLLATALPRPESNADKSDGPSVLVTATLADAAVKPGEKGGK